MSVSEADATALRSRAEAQLVKGLKQRQRRTTSLNADEKQQRTQGDEDQDLKLILAVSCHPEALPPCSEEARLISDVRQLGNDLFAATGKVSQHLLDPTDQPSQIMLNEVRRRDRHMEAQAQYDEEVKAISECLEVTIIGAADHVKELLASIDKEIEAAQRALLKSELLLASDNETVLAMWQNLETVCQHRTNEIAQFASELDQIEQTRIQRVRVGLQELTFTLMETAHVLPPEVERIIEAEAHEVNMVVISNRRVYADLVARMTTANVDIFLRARLAWEEGQIRWRHIRHDDAIARFRATLNSPLFTDPEERRDVLQQIRVFQEKIHTERRLSVPRQLSDAGAALSSKQAKQILDDLSSTQQIEEERNQAFFLDLRALHESKTSAAKALQETLRLELHKFGAMAKEGAIEEVRGKLERLLMDNSMEDFFRVAGGLRAELDALSKQLTVAGLIYNTNLEPVIGSVRLLLSALPLETIMEKRGKSAERKAVQSTLEKLRKATKSEIMLLLPSLQTQISMLMNLDGMNTNFKDELAVVLAQIDSIVLNYSASQANYIMPSIVSSNEAIPAIANNARLNSSLVPTSKSKTNEAAESNHVDLQAIRKVQRRVGTLVYASELNQHWQQLLHVVFDQLQLQAHANRVVDEIICRECYSLVETRQQESFMLVEEIGKRMEEQSAFQHDQIAKLATFFLNVVLCIEESAQKIQYVNLSVMDLLDALKDMNDDILADLEAQFTQSCARLRHSPDDNVLRYEFQRSSNLLMQLEEEYRMFHKRFSLAADKNVIAIDKQKTLYLQRLGDFFGLKPLNQSIGDEFNMDYFLSTKHIDELTNPPLNAPEKEDHDGIETKPLNPELIMHSEIFRASSGLELASVFPLSSLARTILEQNDDKDSAKQDSTSCAAPNEPAGSSRDRREDNAISDGTLGDTVEAVASTSFALRQTVLDKIRMEFLHLSYPNHIVENALATFRDAVLSKYDLDAAATATETEETRDQRHRCSSMILEERLRIHWPRKGRLDVQLYQPRMGELLNHRQRQERHLRGIWEKVDEQHTEFARKLEEAIVHAEQTRMALINFRTQLPLQLSLAALQGLEGKAKNHLGVFKSKGRQMLIVLRSMVANDINSVLSSCQDYIRSISSQLFPDLTSCEIISGCDYHPDEITTIEEEVSAMGAQARQQISEREQQITAVSDSYDQVLAMWQAFRERYQACLQGLAMKESLGQKYGLPRRAAQERYRSEMARCEARSAAINTLLITLQALAGDDGHSELSRDGFQFPTAVVRTLMQLRAKIYQRGMCFGFLRHPSQLELRPIEFFPVTGHRVANDEDVIRDRDVVSEEDRAHPIPFLTLVDLVSANCRDETKALYQQEGKLEDLPQSGVPVALEEYLLSQVEKARSYVIHEEGIYREQVRLFTHLLAVVPGITVKNFTRQAIRQMRKRITGLASNFEPQYRSWMHLKGQHTLELRPHLCSPNSINLLRELQQRENDRSTATETALHDHRYQFLATQIQLSFAFEVELVRLFHCLISLLDSSVLSLDDLKPFSGEELAKPKRKSLKRLRKLERLTKSGDLRDVKRSASDMANVAEHGEIPRFPQRSWAGIPNFGMQVFWESAKAEILATAVENNVQAAVAKAGNSLQDLACESSMTNDGACTALLTPAHRALVRARDDAYVDFVGFCSEETRLFLESVKERLQDEVKWKTIWEEGLTNLGQQHNTIGSNPQRAHSDAMPSTS